MAHSNKSITFDMDVFPSQDNIYSLGSSEKRWKIFGDVTGNIAWSNITSKPTTLSGYGITDAASNSHTHGNISNTGTIGQTSSWALASGDGLVVFDSSNSNKLERTGITFDASTETQCLTKKGTWKTFGTSNLTIGTTSSTAMAGNTVVNKVKTTVKSDDVEYKILGNAGGASPTSGTNYEAIYDTNITMNPSTSTITANIFTGTILKLNALTGGSGTVGGDKGSNANPRYVPSKWYFNAEITPVDGDIITIKVPVAGSDRGVYLSVDNQTTYYPVIYNTNSYITTHFGANACITLYFDSSITTKMYALNGQNNTTTSNVTGAWRVLTLYDSGNNRDYGVRVYCDTTSSSAFNGDYPLLVSRTLLTSLTASSTNNVYAVLNNTDRTKIPTLNPYSGLIKIPGGITASPSIIGKLKLGTGTSDTQLRTVSTTDGYLLFSCPLSTGFVFQENAENQCRIVQKTFYPETVNNGLFAGSIGITTKRWNTVYAQTNNSVYYTINDNATTPVDKVTLQWNSADQSLDFIFV